MRDYRARYQSIKDKGQELGIILAQYMNKEKFLYFTNNYYANFSTIPLEDYLSIKVYDAETNGERLYPLISLAIERITTLEDSSPYKELGYRIISKYEEEDTNKEKKHPIFYLPIELSLLFNPYNEATIEETLARYLLTLFKPKHTTKEQLIELVKKDFNKYALLFDAYFSGGYLLIDKPLEFEDLISLTLNKKQIQKKNILEDAEIQRNQIISVINNEDIFSARGSSPFNSNPEDKEPLFSNEAKEFISNIVNNLPTNTPSFSIFEPYINSFNSGNINFIYLTLTFLVSSKNTLGEIDKQIEDISTFKDKETYLIYKKAYEILFKKKEKRTRVSGEENPNFTSYLPSGTPNRDILFKSLQQFTKVSNNEEKNSIDQYRADFLLREKYKLEKDKISNELHKEQIENGIYTQTYRELDKQLREKIRQIEELSNILDIKGKYEYAPFGYFFLENDFYKTFDLSTRVYQVSPTDTRWEIGENTFLTASTHTASLYTELTNSILIWLIIQAFMKNTRSYYLTNEDIERFILKGSYDANNEDQRKNARNKAFLPNLQLLSFTTLETAFTPSRVAKIKGYKPRTKSGGSILSYTNDYKGTQITLNENIYNIAIKDYDYIPTPTHINKLEPRAYITAIYLCYEAFYSKSNTFKRQLDTIICFNPTYTKLRKDISTNPKRLFTPILNDLEEMKEKNIISKYKIMRKGFIVYERFSLDDYVEIKLNVNIEKPKKK